MAPSVVIIRQFFENVSCQGVTLRCFLDARWREVSGESCSIKTAKAVKF
jgi:hypothetical protein